MKRLFAVLFAAAALAAAVADENRAARVDITSSPEGANVLIDGNLRGVTPLTLYDIAPGRTHHLRFELKSHEPVDEFFPLEQGGYLSRHAELAPVKGLLLVTSEPSGCSIMLDGLSLGETPRLITTLDAKGSYRLLLQKAGYQSREVEVRFNGRTPLVKHENMLLDSGVIEVKTDPEGASVTVNGIARGLSPVTVRDVPRGRASVTLVKAGYEEENRELSVNPGDVQTLFVKMQGRPGSLRLSSVPEGARFYVNGDPHGRGPVTVGNLQPGEYVVRAELDGHDTMEKTIRVANGETVAEEFKLQNVLGRLEIRTAPVGVTVSVDGHVCGVTRNVDPKAEVSEVLVVESLKAGEHTVILKKDGYAEALKHPVVENQKSTKLDVRLKRVFKPDVEIVTNSGTYRGILVDNGPEAIMLEVSMGVVRSFPRVDIRSVSFLDAPEEK
ncbi:MAG: PEGA domain-containing protein [Kiritimatiellae bacterium]|nr:PEGA domain-containing protein [Kiritimatiellia bacterium]